MLQIAVVDDERNIISEITQKLEQYFSEQSVLYRVHPFENGQDFLAHEQTFDIIFLDIRLDGLSGMDVAKTLRQGGVKALLFLLLYCMNMFMTHLKWKHRIFIEAFK